MPRQQIITDLAEIGTPGWIVSWLSNDFQDRKQYTCIGGAKSSSVLNNCGVLQGAVLSPFIFSFHHGALQSSNACSLFKYVDDLVIGGLANSTRKVDEIKETLSRGFEYAVDDNPNGGNLKHLGDKHHYLYYSKWIHVGLN